MSEEIAGQLWHTGLVEIAALHALRERLPYYIAEVCEQHDFEHGLQPIKSWAVVSEYDRFPEEGLPCVMVVAGEMRDTTKDGDGYYSAEIPLGVVVTCAGPTGNGALTRTMAQLYSAAIRGALGQKRTLGDDLQITDWLGESPTADVPTAKRRTQCAIGNDFIVHRKKIFTAKGGPASIEPPVPTELAEIISADVEAGPPDDD